MRLLLPLIVFGAVFWIGLQGNSAGSGSHAPRVDPTTLVQQRASWKVGNYPSSNRLRGASPQSETGSSKNKAWDLTVPKVDGGGNPQVPPPAQVKGEGEKTWDVAIPKIDTTVGGSNNFPPAPAAPRAPKGEGEKSWEVAIPKLDTTMGGRNKLPPPPVVVTQPPIKGEGEKTWEVAIPKVEALSPGAVDEGQAPPRLVVADEPLINVPHSETPPPSELKATDAPELKATDAPESVQSSAPHTRALQKAEDSNIKVVSLYLESRTSLDVSTQPLPVRRTSAENLRRLNFENLKTCTDLPQSLPVDDFPDDDPWLPWIHDYFVTADRSAVQVVAQNKRRCETGDGKEVVMAYWEPQMSLFQPVPVAQVKGVNNETLYRLAAPGDKDMVAAETRFQCRFHGPSGEEWITFSEFPFNYEYIAWRKHIKPMFTELGKDVDQIELSQLLFSCPLPKELKIRDSVAAPLWLDIIPIRTPPRKDSWLLTESHVGPDLLKTINAFNATKSYGTNHFLPAPTDAGRWANLPVCLGDDNPPPAKHSLVACTWASASYKRRGNEIHVDDTAARLREWLHYNRLVGVDHVYLYDNTPVDTYNGTQSPLYDIVDDEFADYVTHVPWPASVCSNNRPGHKNPGERSSQYAAEASCRERFGSHTEWMTFLDVDEYLVPLNNELNWPAILEKKEKEGYQVLKLRSSRGRPRLDYLAELADDNLCSTSRHIPHSEDSCIAPRSNETFLKVYNCDFMPPPRPERFSRAMKQIYKPAFVQQHFVHYSAVTGDMSTYYQDLSAAQQANFTKGPHESAWGDVFLDDVTEGVLIHAKTVLPFEMVTRSFACQTGSKNSCAVGHVCSSTTVFNDTIQKNNQFLDDEGRYCNCWVNPHIESKILPKLEAVLRGD